MKISRKNYQHKIEDREDVFIFQEILNSRLFENVSIIDKVKLCIDFVESSVLPLAYDENFVIDIEYARLYLESKISPRKLRIRE